MKNKSFILAMVLLVGLVLLVIYVSNRPTSADVLPEEGGDSVLNTPTDTGTIPDLAATDTPAPVDTSSAASSY